MNKILVNAIIQLRRDNDYNYDKIKDTFIPANGEVVLVDTARNGLRAKVGDGTTTYANLTYVDEDISSNIIIRGYLIDEKFYLDQELLFLVEPSETKIYIDIKTNKIYFYSNSSFININSFFTSGSAETPGIVKLYNTIGDNSDGAITQQAVTNALKKKVEVKADLVDEALIFI